MMMEKKAELQDKPEYLLAREDEFIQSDHAISVFVHFLLSATHAHTHCKSFYQTWVRANIYEQTHKHFFND